MKKSVLLLAAAFGVSSAFAQDLTSKKGEPYLPEAGDWSIGIDATPFLNYAGNMLSSGGNTAPSWNFLTSGSPFMIAGKMFKDEKTAYRAAIRLASNSNKYSNGIADAAQLTASASTNTASFQESTAPKVDQAKIADRFIGLSGGLEMRRGKTRLQGFYGGEFGIWGGSTKSKYEYGNALTQNSTNPAQQFDANNTTYSTDWNAVNPSLSSNVVANLDNYGYLAGTTDAARILKSKTGGFIGLGVRGFIGAEYFLFPKISLAGEFGWGIGYQMNGKDKITFDAEGTDGSGNQTAKEVEYKSPVKQGSFLGIDTDNKNSMVGPSANLRLNLHF